MSANYQIVLLEVLLGGFFAVACLRASVPTLSASRLSFTNFLHMPGRIERLRRSRWQWFSMVALMLVLRLQGALPLVLEGMALVQFVIFLALPTRAKADHHQESGNESAMGAR